MEREMSVYELDDSFIEIRVSEYNRAKRAAAGWGIFAGAALALGAMGIAFSLAPYFFPI